MVEIEIVNWWNAKVHENPDKSLNPKSTLNQFGKLTICTILIDKKIVGCIQWDGIRLSISEELVSEECLHLFDEYRVNNKVHEGHCLKCKKWINLEGAH